MHDCEVLCLSIFSAVLLQTPSVTSKTVSPVYNHSNSSSFSGSDPGVITTDNIQDLKVRALVNTPKKAL